MRKLFFWLGAALAVGAARAEDFTKTMTAEELAATGLGKLSAAELAKLKAVVERYKAGEVTVVRAEAQKQVAAAEAKVAQVEQAAAAPAPAKAKEPGWLGALLTLKRTQEKLDTVEALETRLAGSLKSFSGKRKFTLENGQIWQMIEAESYNGPELTNPTVTVRPGSMDFFWLKIPEAALRAKVKPIKLE